MRRRQFRYMLCLFALAIATTTGSLWHNRGVAAAHSLTAIACGSSPWPACPTHDWHSVPSANGDAVNGENTLAAIAGSQTNDLWAVGYYFDGANLVDLTIAEHWDGRSWTLVPTPIPSGWEGRLLGVSVRSSSDVWAVGWTALKSTTEYYTLIEHWDGHQWSIVPSPSPNVLGAQGEGDELYGVAALAPDNVWAVGFSLYGYEQPFIEHWDGNAWSVVASPSANTLAKSQLYSVTALAPDDIWAVGYYTGDNLQTLTEHWDGTKWTIISSPSYPTASTDTILLSVSATSSTDIWAVGWWYQYTTGTRGGLREHWDGTSWAIANPPANSPSGNSSLAAVTVVNHSLAYAVGGTMSPGTRPRVERWDGTSWSVIPSSYMFGQDSELNGVFAFSQSYAWGVGGAGSLTLVETPLYAQPARPTFPQRRSDTSSPPGQTTTHDGVNQTLVDNRLTRAVQEVAASTQSAALVVPRAGPFNHLAAR